MTNRPRPDMKQPRLTTMMGVARALMATLTDDETIDVMCSEFGWDATFLVFATLKGEDAARLFGLTWETLLTADIRNDVRGIGGV